MRTLHVAVTAEAVEPPQLHRAETLQAAGTDVRSLSETVHATS